MYYTVFSSGQQMKSFDFKKTSTRSMHMPLTDSLFVGDICYSTRMTKFFIETMLIE
jgi:hypothetical protein